jgi:outer membrane protein assembly factor BamA
MKSTLFGRLMSILTLWLWNYPAFAMQDSTDHAHKIISSTQYAPFISAAPETSLIVGLQATHLWRPLLQRDDERPSNIALTGLVSLRGQWSIGAQFDTYFNNFQWRLFGNAAFERFPLDFFGTGVHPVLLGEHYTPQTWRGAANVAYRVLQTPKGAGLSLGAGYTGRADRMVSLVQQGVLESGMIVGANGGVVSGAGVLALLDTRDNVFSSYDGFYLEARSTVFTPLLGSEYSFVRHSIDTRLFVPLSVLTMQHILALQGGFTALTGGEAPFYALPSLSSLRGFLIGQYADRTSVFGQIEYRVPFLEIFEAVVFAGVGTSASAPATLSTQSLQTIVGGGVRFFFDPNERLGIRLDIGVPLQSSFGNTPRLYFTFGEAF